LALSCSVHAANETLGPEGIVPVTLVFGIISPIGTKQPKQPEMLQAIISAGREMRDIMAQLNVNRALRRDVTVAADTVFAPGDLVLVFREDPEGFSGPFTVQNIVSKTVFARNDQGEVKPFSCTQVKPFRQIYDPQTKATEVFTRMFSSIAAGIHQTFVTEVIRPSDTRSFDTKMKAAKQKQIRGLLERGTFKIVLRNDIPKGANKLGGRYVLTIKDSGTDREIWKARYVIQGHWDQENEIMVRSSTNVQQRSLRIIFALASNFGFKIWTQDVTQAYLQSSGTLARKVFIEKPASELELCPNQALQLLKPLYGLADSGDFFVSGARTASPRHGNEYAYNRQ
jgi:Reverse transcriptase (RNA-dependent DNA polymerase)